MATTTFSISGERNRRHITITWTDGELSGDPPTVWWIRQYAQMLDGTMQGQVGGPYTTHDHLQSPYTARALIKSVFPGPTTQHGHLPAIDLPDGAIM